MNNFLPILLMMALGKKDGATMEALAPVMKMLGVDTKMLEGITDTSGKGLSIEKLLPLMMNMMGSQPTPTPEQNKNGAKDTAPAPNYLKPITDIADERINYALAHYFANS